jgi:hemin uptake protein HemP
VTDRSSTNPGADGGREPSAPSGDPRRPPGPSEQLLQGRRIVEITHNGEVYRLQATRLGKLILTK